MKRHLIATALMLTSTAASAQNPPGDQFLQDWDLNQDGTAMRSRRASDH